MSSPARLPAYRCLSPCAHQLYCPSHSASPGLTRVRSPRVSGTEKTPPASRVTGRFDFVIPWCAGHSLPLSRPCHPLAWFQTFQVTRILPIGGNVRSGLGRAGSGRGQPAMPDCSSVAGPRRLGPVGAATTLAGEGLPRRLRAAASSRTWLCLEAGLASLAPPGVSPGFPYFHPEIGENLEVKSGISGECRSQVWRSYAGIWK